MRGKQTWILLAVVVLWAGGNAPRLAGPLTTPPYWHDLYNGSQDGAFAHNHLQLGLGVTRGANVWAVDYSGKPFVYYSYSPLASYLLALPMLGGVSLQVSVRLVAFLLFVWFLVAFWSFARNVWGVGVANVAVAVAALLPINLRYGLSSIWEVMAMGPLFSALALFASPRPRDRSWVRLTALCGTVAALFSWLAWLALLPCLWREVRRGHRRPALVTAAWVLAVPLAIQIWGIHVAALPLGSILGHLHDRMSGAAMTMGQAPISHVDLVQRFLIWCFKTPIFYGFLASGITAAVLVRAALGRLVRGMARVPGAGWLLLLTIYGVPFTLIARNMASWHDYFLILFAPLVALCCGIGASLLWRDRGREGRGTVGFSVTGICVVLAVGATATWPAAYVLRPAAGDAGLRDLAVALGAMVQPDSVLLASPRACDSQPEQVTAPLTLPARDTPLAPYVGGLTGKTAYLCRNRAELLELQRQLGPGRPVVVVEGNGELDPLPPGARLRQDFPPFTVAEYPPARAPR